MRGRYFRTWRRDSKPWNHNSQVLYPTIKALNWVLLPLECSFKPWNRDSKAKYQVTKPSFPDTELLFRDTTAYEAEHFGLKSCRTLRRAAVSF